MEKRIGIILIFGVVGFTSSFPISEDKCSKTVCKIENRKFNYKPGTSYQYKYETNVSISTGEDSERSSQLFLTATVHFDILDYCEWNLRVSDVQIEEQHPTEDGKATVANEDVFKAALQDNPLRFSFYDGLVERICSTNLEEPQWSLNIKRGIINSIQNSQKRLDNDHDGNEVGIEGVCEFSYVVRLGAEKTVDVTKTRNSCRNSGQVTSRFHGVPYKISESAPSSYVSRSAECVQSFHSKRFAQVTCKESVSLTPTKSSRGEVVISQSLLFVQEDEIDETAEKAAIRGHVGIQLSSEKSKHQVASDEEVDALLNEHCSNEEASSLEREDFVTHLLEKVSLKKLEELMNMESCLQEIIKEKVLFSDSFVSMATVRNLIATGNLEEDKIKDWTKRLVSVSNPTINHLVAVEPLLEATPVNEQYWLAVSGLAGKLCLVDPSSANSEEVKRLVKKLSEPISASCQPTLEEKDNVMVALRSLANAGPCVISSSTLSTCISPSTKDVALRAFSLESLRLSSCTASRDEAFSVFKNQSEPIEIRIGAFHAAVSCANVKMIQEIRRSLDSEESLQVKSYVYTFLKSMQESSSPSALPLQSLVGTEAFNVSVDNNFLKFSRNDELSFYSKELDIGTQLQTSVLFAGELFLPRTARVNLTADLFGRSYNVFELYLRGEGFENLARDYLFGANEKKNEAGLYSKWNDEYRFEELDREYEKSRRTTQVPKVTLFSRSFGREVAFETIQNPQGFKDVLKRLNPFKTSSLPLKDAGYTERTFFEESLSLPTICGISLKIKASGMAKIRSKTATEADVASFLAYGKANINWNIDNRVTVPLTAEMRIELPFIESGISLNALLASEVRTQGHLVMKSWNDIDFKFQLPDEESVKLVELSSETRLLHNGKSVPAVDPESTGMTQYIGCFGPREKWSWALKLCAKADIPESLLGKSTYAVYWKKNTESFTDVTLKHKVQMKSGAIHVDTRLAVNSESESNDLLLLRGEATMKEAKGQKEIRLNLKAKAGKNDYLMKGEFLHAPDNVDVAAEVFSEDLKICFVKAAWSKTPKLSKFTTSVQLYKESKTYEMTVDLSNSDKKDILLHIVLPGIAADGKGTLKVGPSSSKGSFDYSYTLAGSKKRFGALELKDADSNSVWKRLDFMFSTADNEQFKNKDVVVWNHMLSESVQGYSIEIAGPSYTYLNTIYHRDKIEGSSFEFAFKAANSKAEFHYEGNANLTITDNLVSLGGNFLGSKQHGFYGNAVWSTNGAEVNWENTFEVKAGSQQGNLFSLNSRMVAKQPAGFSLVADGMLGEDADFKCRADLQYSNENNTKQPKKLDSSLSLTSSKFEPITGSLSFAVHKDEIAAKFEAKHGKENGAGLQFESKKKSFLGNGEFRLSGMTYKSEVSYDGNTDELLAEIHLDSQRDIWLRLHRNATLSNAIKRYIAEIKWDVNRDPTEYAKVTLERSQRTRGQDKVKIEMIAPNNKIRLIWAITKDNFGYTTDVTGNFGMNAENSFTIAVADQKNCVRFQAKSNMTYHGFRDSSVIVSLNRTMTQHNLTFHIVRDGSERLKLTSVGKDEKSLEKLVLSETASLYAPSLREEPVDLVFILQRNGNGYGCKLDLKFSEEKMLNFDTNLLAAFGVDDTLLNADLKIVTPFPSMPHLNIGLNHVSTFRNNFRTNNTVFVALNEDRHEAGFEVGLKEDSSSYGAKLSVGSPLIGTAPVLLAGYIRPSLSTPAVQIELGMPSSKVVMIAKVDKQQDGGMVAVMSLEAPFLEGNKLEVLGEWNLGEKVVLKASALLGTGKGFRFESRYFFISLKNFDVGFILKTPWDEYENGGLLVQFAGDDNFDVVNGTVVGTFNNDEYTFGFFKETTNNTVDKFVKGELLIGLPRSATLTAVGSYRIGDEIFSVNILAEQGSSNGKFKLEHDKSKMKEGYQLTVSNSRLLPLPIFEITADMSSLLEEEEERRNNTNSAMLSAKYTPVGGKTEEVTVKALGIARTEPTDFGEESYYSEAILDFSSTFEGFENMQLKVAHDSPINYGLIHVVTFLGFDKNVTLKSDLNFGEEKTLMEMRITDLKMKKNQFYRITSKYSAGDEISVKGKFSSSNPKYKTVPWTLEIVKKGGSSAPAEEEDYSEWGEFQRDEAVEEATESKKEEEWSLAVKLGIELPDKPLTGSLFVNGTLVDARVEGPWDGQVYVVVEPSDEQFTASAKIALDGREIIASGTVEYVESFFHKFIGKMDLPFESMQNVAVELERVLDGPGSMIITKFAWDGKEVTANLGCMLSSFNHFDIDVQITSPFEEAETITFIISQKGGEVVKTTANIYFPRRITALIYWNLLRLSYKHESTFENGFSVAKIQSGGSALTRDTESKIGFDMSWELSAAKATVQHDISVTAGDVEFATDGMGSYAIDDGNTIFEASLLLPGLSRLRVKADGQFTKEMSDGVVEASTDTDPVRLSINHDLASTEKAARVHVNLPNGDEYETQLRFDAQRLPNAKTSQIRIRSPISFLEDLQGDFLLKQNGSGFGVQALVKSIGNPILSMNAEVDEDLNGPLKQYKGVVDLTSSMQKLAKLKAVYDRKYTTDQNIEHELALTVNDFDESKWKYIKALQQDSDNTKEVVELEGKYIIWPVALNYLYVKEYPTGKQFPTNVKRTFSIFDADEPKLRADIHSMVEITEFGKVFKIELAKVAFITKYHQKRGSWIHGTELQLDTNGSRNFGYEVQLNGTTIADCKARLILIVPQRSFGVGAIMKSNGKSFGAQAEISWDVTQTEPRVVKAYFQIDDVTGNLETGKKWKLGLKQRQLKQDLLIEGDVYRDRAGNIRGSSEFRYLPGPEHCLRGTVEFSGALNFPELLQKSGLTLSLPKAKLKTTMSQSFSVNLKSIHWDTLVNHARDDSFYNSTRSLDATRMSDRVYLYKVSLPEGTYETVGTLNKVNGSIFAELKMVGGDATSVNYLNYTNGEYPIFKLHSSSSNADPWDEVFDLVYQWNDDRSVSLHSESRTREGISVPLYGHLALNTSHLLTSSLKWQPNLSSDVKKFFASHLEERLFEFLNFLLDIYFKSRDEMTEIVEFVQNDMQQIIEPFKEDISSEIEKIISDSEAIEELFESMYQQNDFLMKTVVGFAKILLEEYPVDTVLSEFKQWLAAKQEELTEGITSKTYDFESWASDLETQIENLKTVWTERIYEPFVSSIGYLRETLSDAFWTKMVIYDRVMVSLGNRLSNSVSAVFVEVRNTLYTIGSTVYEQLKPGLLTAGDIIETSLLQIKNKLSSLFSSDSTSDNRESFMESMSKLEEKIKGLIEDINFEKLEEILDNFVTKLRKELAVTGNLGTYFENFLQIAQSAKKYILESWNNNFEVTGDLGPVWELIKENLEKGSGDADSQISFFDVIGNIRDSFSNSATQTLVDLKEYRTKMVFVPEEGHFQLEQVLPFPWYSLREEPHYKDLKNSLIFSSLADFFSEEDDESVLYQIFEQMLEDEPISQTYDGVAALDITGFISTFHRNILDLKPANNCSYLLLRNFDKKDASLILENGQKGKEGIITLLVGGQRIDIIPKAVKDEDVVKVDDNPVILPYRNEEVYITLQGVTLRAKTEELFVSCRLDTRNCEVTVSGRFLSQYAGLLGRYDLEVSPDKTKPNGEKAADQLDLLASWQASKQCTPQTSLKPLVQTKDNLCSSFFESGSSGLVNCYGFVDPSPYLSHCNYLAQADKNADRCVVVSAYEVECRRKDVDVDIPSDCLKCKGEDSTVFSIGETRKFSLGKAVKPVADILFVIENGQCVSEHLKQLRDLVSKIDKELLNPGKMKNNKYGFLVYGEGAGIVSLNKVQLFSEKNVSKIVEHLKNTYPVKTSGEANLNVVKEAIENFPFRYYASRSIVFVPCSVCKAVNVSMHKSLVSWLESSRIPVHVLFNEEFSFLKPSEQRTIFGFNIEGGMTQKRSEVKKIQNHVQLLQQSAGVCEELAFRTNGTIFAAPRLLDQKPAVVAFTRALTSRAQPEKCQVCRCTRKGLSIDTKLVCEPCGSS